MAGKTKFDEEVEKADVAAKSISDKLAHPPTPEEVQTNSIFDRQKAKAKTGIDMSKLTLKTNLTVALFSIAHSKELVIKCTSEIYDKKLPNAGRGKAEETDTKLVDIINLETGETGALICNSLIVGAFERAKAPLLNRIFAIREGGIREGKKYRSMEVAELSE